MSSEVIAALVGAIAGAASGGLVAWLLQRSQIRAERNWGIALDLSQTLGSILSAYAADGLKTQDDVYELQRQWGQKARQSSLLGIGGTGDSIGVAMNDYFQALREFVDGKMKRGELEHRRAHCKDVVQTALQAYSRFR
jgi:hypothetical protein